jgi:hypothetical protein
MNEEEIIKLNKKRLQVQLTQFYSMIGSKAELESFKCAKYLDVNDGNKEIALKDIDFTRSIIFIADFNILPFLSIYALQKVSNVLHPDTSLSGRYSRITKDYMYAEASEMRYASKASLDLGKEMDIPDMYKPELFTIKPLVIWRLNETIDIYYAYCCERITERQQRGRNFANWCFFQGSLDEFHNKYKGMPSNIPLYRVIVPNGSKKTTTTRDNTKVVHKSKMKEVF